MNSNEPPGRLLDTADDVADGTQTNGGKGVGYLRDYFMTALVRDTLDATVPR